MAVPPSVDPDDLEKVFVDGDHEYAVCIAPAAFPTLLLIGEGAGTFSELIFRFAATLGSLIVAGLRDSRWKVVVLRARLKKPALWHAIDVRFVESAERAATKQLEILQNWDSSRHAQQPVIPLRDVRRLRLDSREHG